MPYPPPFCKFNWNRRRVHMLYTGAQIVMECLLEQGVDRVFGYPGNAALKIYDALYEYRDSIHHVLMTHEQHAAHAADGYARATGRTGVALSTSGPGATNLLTGLSASHMDSTPVVAITCNVNRPSIGKDSFQEVDIYGVSMPVTKHNYMVKDVHALADTLRSAFRIASSGRPGPVLVDILSDVAEAECEFSPRPPARPAPVLHADSVDLLAASSLIDEAVRPMFIAGGGIISAGAEAELLALAEKLHAPVALTLMGIGAFPATHPLYAGMLGMFGTPAAAECLAESDLVIAVGTRLSDRSIPSRDCIGPDARLLHIDIDAAEINKNLPADISLIGDAQELLSRLLQSVSEKKENVLCSHIEPPLLPMPASPGLHPAQILSRLGKMAGPGQIYTTEVGEHQIWAASFLPIGGPRKFLTPGGLGAMGFGLGAAIGAAFGTGERIINIAGDGSFYMNLAELSTAMAYHLPILEIVFNNKTLGMVRQMQKTACGGRLSAVDLNRPTDFLALSRAFGAKAYRIAAREDIAGVLQSALAASRQGPCVVECVIDPEEAVFAK